MRSSKRSPPASDRRCGSAELYFLPQGARRLAEGCGALSERDPEQALELTRADPDIASDRILEKRHVLEENHDWLRCALTREPRGHNDMFGAFLMPPSRPDYDAGLIYIDDTQYSHMCQFDRSTARQAAPAPAR